MAISWINIDTTPKMAFGDCADVLAQLVRAHNNREAFILRDLIDFGYELGEDPADGSILETNNDLKVNISDILSEIMTAAQALVDDSRDNYSCWDLTAFAPALCHYTDSDGTKYSGVGHAGEGGLDNGGKDITKPGDWLWYINRLRDLYDGLQYAYYRVNIRFGTQREYWIDDEDDQPCADYDGGPYKYIPAATMPSEPTGVGTSGSQPDFYFGENEGGSYAVTWWTLNEPNHRNKCYVIRDLKMVKVEVPEVLTDVDIDYFGLNYGLVTQSRVAYPDDGDEAGTPFTWYFREASAADWGNMQGDFEPGGTLWKSKNSNTISVTSGAGSHDFPDSWEEQTGDIASAMIGTYYFVSHFNFTACTKGLPELYDFEKYCYWYWDTYPVETYGTRSDANGLDTNAVWRYNGDAED